MQFAKSLVMCPSLLSRIRSGSDRAKLGLNSGGGLDKGNENCLSLI